MLQIVDLPDIPIGMTTNEKFRLAIREAGYSQIEFAKLAGYTRTTLNDLLNGKREIDRTRQAQMARLLDRPMEDFDDDDLIQRQPPTAVGTGPLKSELNLTLDELLILRLLRARGLTLDQVLTRLSASEGSPAAIASHNTQPGAGSKSG